jgi:hypothetical protein
LALTRAGVAAEALRSLGLLGRSLKTTAIGDLAEGDLTDPLNMTLRDCGLATIADCTTTGQERAVILGTTYYALVRLYRDRAAEITSQMGAGASGMHLSIDPSTALGSLRLHLTETLDNYKLALAAVGKSLGVDPSSGFLAPIVFVDDEDERSKALVVGESPLPWFQEGYHEVR